MASQAPKVTVNIPTGDDVKGTIRFKLDIPLKDNNSSLEELFSKSYDEVVNQILDDTVFESEEDKKQIDEFVSGLKQMYIMLLNETNNKNSLKLFTTKPGQLQDAGKRRKKMRGGELTNRQKVLAKMIAGVAAFIYFYFRYFELINGLETYKSDTVPTLCTTETVTELEQELMTPSLSFSSIVNKEGYLSGIRQRLTTCGNKKEDFKFNLNSYQLQIQSTISFAVLSIAFAIPTELLTFILAGIASVATVSGQGNVVELIKNLTKESQTPMRTLEEATSTDVKKEKEEKIKQRQIEIQKQMDVTQDEIKLARLQAELNKLQEQLRSSNAAGTSSSTTTTSNAAGTGSSTTTTRPSKFGTSNVMTISELSGSQSKSSRGRESSTAPSNRNRGGRRTKRHQMKRRMTKRR